MINRIKLLKNYPTIVFMISCRYTQAPQTTLHEEYTSEDEQA